MSIRAEEQPWYKEKETTAEKRLRAHRGVTGVGAQSTRAGLYSQRATLTAVLRRDEKGKGAG